ncbi:MAG TPA: hypothetical protein VK814_08455 [Acidobacteriaceae bacterium]|nr:hypothetical protein [Acidobacteriaceae bacterium]
MSTKSKVWGVRLVILLATCLGVFVLPFLLPARYFQGVSASNLAGFNNEVAAISAAALGTLVFFLALKWPQILRRDSVEPAALKAQVDGPLSRRLVGAVVLLWGTAVLLFGLTIIWMGVRYEYDWGYFLNRISVHAEFGRKLYSEMEFAYGPLLIDFAVIVRAILSPLHVSAVVAYLVTFVLEVMGGLLMMVYLIDRLPMSKRWRAVIFLLIAAGMMVTNMGPNYTFVRFAPQLVFLMLAWNSKRVWQAALWMFVGQAVCLGVSPEIGFAFLVGSFTLALYCCFTKARSWAWAAAAPIVSAMIFLLVEGWPYLHRVGISAHGVYSFPVEPLPFVLVFLFALVWMVPLCLADSFRQRRPEAPMLATLYLMSLALLPAGFGRADPAHVFWNGLSVLLLSAVAMSSRPRWQQIAWGGSLAIVILWMCNINRSAGGSWQQMKPVVGAEATLGWNLIHGRLPIRVPRDNGFDLPGLQAIVGHDPVATPAELPLPVEKSLRDSGQYTPSFYNFYFNLFDAAAEDRQIQEFNQSRWALIPKQETFKHIERPEDLKSVLGLRLPYRARRPVYVVGSRFVQNLAQNWKLRGSVGNYLVYEHV